MKEDSSGPKFPEIRIGMKQNIGNPVLDTAEVLRKNTFTLSRRNFD